MINQHGKQLPWLKFNYLIHKFLKQGTNFFYLRFWNFFKNNLNIITGIFKMNKIKVDINNN